MRKLDFCICENKDADQLRGNRKADQRLCFRHTDSTIPLFPKSEISSLLPSCVVVQPSLCGTWLDNPVTPKTCFLTRRLIYCKPSSVYSSHFRVLVFIEICVAKIFCELQNWTMQEPIWTLLWHIDFHRFLFLMN